MLEWIKNQIFQKNVMAEIKAQSHDQELVNSLCLNQQAWAILSSERKRLQPLHLKWNLEAYIACFTLYALSFRRDDLPLDTKKTVARLLYKINKRAQSNFHFYNAHAETLLGAQRYYHEFAIENDLDYSELEESQDL